ncbi:MAG: protein phosphatase 2C domain-containing protein [Paludibacter sp.]
MAKLFDTAYINLKLPSKAKCGDSFKIEYIADEELLICMVCDGVGSRPADYLASGIACEELIPSFTKHKESPLEVRITQSVKEIHSKLLDVEGLNKGLMSTMTLLVWDVVQEIYYSVNIGDSRTYGLKLNRLIQLTRDETKSVILRDRSGKPLTSDSFAITREGITNALGSNQLSIEVHKESSVDISGFVLATDGFYNCINTFDSDMISILNRLEMQINLNDIIQHNYKDEQVDDLTGIFVRRKAIPLEVVFIEITKDLTSEQIFSKFSKFDILNYVSSELESLIRLNDTNRFLELIKAADSGSIDLGRNRYIQLISFLKTIGSNNGTIYQELYQRMKKSKSM